MSERAVVEILERLAKAVVLADAADRGALEGLSRSWAALCEAAPSGPLGERAKAGAARLAQMLAEPASAAAGLAALSDEVSVLRGLCDGAAAAPAGDQPGRFVLPEWVEQVTFGEFIAQHKGALQEIEAEVLLGADQGELPMPALRRRLHSLKGEAGVVGCRDLELAYHATEDLLEAALPLGEKTERFLGALDWMGQALGAYVQSLLPVPDSTALIASLRLPPAAAASAASAAAPAAPAAAAAAAPPAPPQAPGALPAAAAPATAVPNPWDADSISLLGEFLQESGEALAQADQALMNLEADGDQGEKIGELFRTFHTIKGVSGFLGLGELTALAHAAETVLDRIRDGKLELRGLVVDAILDATGALKRMMDGARKAAEAGVPVPPAPEGGPLAERLIAIAEQRAVEAEPLPKAAPGARLGDILAVPEAAARAALEKQKETGRRFGEELVAQGTAEPKQVAQALRAQREEQGASAIKEMIKVDVDRVDSLVEMIGELVIVQSMVTSRPEIQAIGSHQVRNYLGQLTKITRDLQSVGMRMRMTPVRGVFQKMGRLVHDLARKSGKQVRLVLSGEGSEMDRSMVEQISDPLVHMIRNAVDHGIETPEQRAKTGKPPVATLQLSAFHEGGSIAIEIKDDGRGLDRDAILTKARERGVIRPDQALAESEIYELIFAAGFSTAAQITELSGRGVGMDVVKRNVEAMRGRIFTTSAPGHGTTFKLVLPLTLAIIDGMLVACGDERYIIPTLSIVESIQPDRSMLFSSAGKGEVINLRGEILTLLRLDKLFDVADAKRDPTQALVVVLESFGRRFGLLVDSVITQQQVVIKSLGAGLSSQSFVSGAAILSDGKVGLILNVDEVGRLLGERSFRGAGTPIEPLARA